MSQSREGSSGRRRLGVSGTAALALYLAALSILAFGLGRPSEAEERERYAAQSVTGFPDAAPRQQFEEFTEGDDGARHYVKTQYHHSGTLWGNHRLASQYQDSETGHWWIHNNNTMWHDITSPSTSLTP